MTLATTVRTIFLKTKKLKEQFEDLDSDDLAEAGLDYLHAEACVHFEDLENLLRSMTK